MALSLHLEHLNPEQLAAVTLPDEHALVLAGAGSGKTRVLTTRMAWLVKGGRVAPSGILAVTFTNKAAREMLTRVGAMMTVNPRGMWIGTFHGLCNRMLRAHAREAGLPAAFQILDSQDQLAAIKRLLKGMNVDEERFPPREVQYFINGNKEEGVRGRDVPPADDNTRRFAELYTAYDEQCQREGVVDFSELLLRSYELLSQERNPARALRPALPPHPDRRVPGHQPAAVPLAEADRPPLRSCSRSATTTRASTPSAARTSATWPTSSASSR